MKIENKKGQIITESILGGVILVGILGYGIYAHLNLKNENQSQKNEIIELKKNLTGLNQNLFDAQAQNQELAEALADEKTRNDEFENQVNKISGTVGTLQKLSQTDPELLKKYSKIYFLNENYTPSELITLSPDAVYPKEKLIELHAKVWPFMERLLNDAQEDDINLRIISGYRSFGTQAALKNSYKVTYGAGTANSFSADQGYSEHQLGTAVDFTTLELGTSFESFANTEAYKWLLKNAYKYGFIISYPKTNQYYQFEPWHWRFVGVKLAEKIHEDEINFYDMDQRAIDAYLVSLFD